MPFCLLAAKLIFVFQHQLVSQILITAAMHIGHALTDEFIRVRIIEESQGILKRQA